jgi:hypothetical protein
MIKKTFIFVSCLFFLIITASYNYAASVELAWDPPADGGDVVGYLVYGSTVSNNYNNPVVAKTVEEPNITISGLDETQTYYFIVKAYNCAGIGEPSNEVKVPANSDAFHDDSSGSSLNNSEGGGGGGCFIATAVYGSKFESHVKILRKFRDSCLMQTGLGRAFVNLYNEYSPALADDIRRHDTMRTVVRWGLAPVVGMAYVVLNTSMTEKIGIVVGMMILMAGSLIRLSSRRKVKGERLRV